MSPAFLLFSSLKVLAAAAVVLQAMRWAFNFRTHAIRTYGTVIHEFGARRRTHARPALTDPRSGCPLPGLRRSLVQLSRDRVPRREWLARVLPLV